MLTAVLAILSLLATLLINSVVDITEADADNFSLTRVNDQRGLSGPSSPPTCSDGSPPI